MKNGPIKLFLSVVIVFFISLTGALFIPSISPTIVSAQAGMPQVAWTATIAQGKSLTGSNFTCREMTRPSIAGNTIRIHLSNLFGSVPQTINAVSVALRTSRAAVSNITAVNFGGQRSVTIAAHSQVTSDPITFTVSAQQDVAVSVYYAGANPMRSVNPGTLKTSYCTDFGGAAGDHTNDPADSAFTVAETVAWAVSAVDVYQSAPHGAVVALGSSTTQGWASTIDGNNSWVDVLSSRLVASSNPKSVVNEGLGGDSACPPYMLPPGAPMPFQNDSGVLRVNRDGLALTNVSDVILLIGSNDISNYGATGDVVISCDQNIISQVHSAGLKVFGVTIAPRSLAPTQDAYRVQVNNWIKTSGAFDGVIDFDVIIRDPNNPSQILPAYNSGDNIHANPQGHAAMGNAIPLSLFSTSGGSTANGISTANSYDDQNYWAFSYTGDYGWGHDGGGCTPGCYNGTNSWDSTTNDTVTVTFTGTQIKFYGVKAPGHGIGAVSIDGGGEVPVDFYAATRAANQLLWTSPTLSNATHTFKLRVTGTKNASSSGLYVAPDRVDILDGISATAWYNVINQNSNKCADAAGWGTADGTPVVQWTCGTGYNQQWQFVSVGSGYYKVLPRYSTTLTWNVTGGSGATGDSIPVELRTYSGVWSQQWQAVSLGGGYYKFVAHHSGKCLEVPGWSMADGTQLTQYTCNGGANQSFHLVQQP